MEALKWVGYTVAAILGLSVIVGVVMAISTIVLIGGALVCLLALVVFTAALIRDWWNNT